MYDFIALSLKCPVCGESLMDHEHMVDNKPSIKLNIEINRRKGIIRLSSIYGSFNHDTDIDMKKDEVAKFICPHCEAHITSDGRMPRVWLRHGSFLPRYGRKGDNLFQKWMQEPHC